MKNLMKINKNGQLIPSLFEGQSLESYFDEVFNDFRITKPLVNVYESKKEFSIDIAMPSVNKSDFIIELKGDNLEVSMDRTDNYELDDVSYKQKEFSYTSFKKSFSLPENAYHEKIKADYINGVLKIVIPKTKNKDSPNRLIKIN